MVSGGEDGVGGGSDTAGVCGGAIGAEGGFGGIVVLVVVFIEGYAEVPDGSWEYSAWERVGSGRWLWGGVGVRLVDYDGMWVPALASMPPMEYGHRDYQHPGRQAYYGAAMDRFPLLVMYAGLYALASRDGDRRLYWERYDTGDNLLFRAEDFREVGKSGLCLSGWGAGSDEQQGREWSMVQRSV